MLGEAYAGKTILLTGGTGFLGTALVEKILRSLPDLGRLYLVIRPSRGKSAAERFERDVLGAAAFRGLREKLGDDFEDLVSRRFASWKATYTRLRWDLARKISQSSRARWTS